MKIILIECERINEIKNKVKQNKKKKEKTLQVICLLVLHFNTNAIVFLYYATNTERKKKPGTYKTHEIQSYTH